MQSGPRVGQHRSRHFAVQSADAVRAAGQAQRQCRHRELVVVRGRAPEVEELVPVEAEARRDPGEVAAHQLLVEAVVAGRDGGVRREQRAAAHDDRRLLVREPLLLDQAAYAPRDDARFLVWIPALGGVLALPLMGVFLFWPTPTPQPS